MATKKIKVLHIVAPNFGSSFSGQGLRTLELLRDWHDPLIDLEPYGSALNQEIGTNLWMSSRKNTRIIRLFWSVRVLCRIFFIRDYDIIQLYVQWWGGLLVPLICHLAGKKCIYIMTLQGADNPSAVKLEFLGNLKIWLLKKFDGIICLTNGLANDCIKHGFKESSLIILPNSAQSILPPPDNNKIRDRIKYAIPNDAMVMIFVGSIIFRKGIDILVKIFCELAVRYSDIWILLVGPQTSKQNPTVKDQYVADQKKVLNDSGLFKRVIWTGLVNSPHELSKLYAMSDIFVFPTRAEGQGNVIVEAMDHKLPVVTTRLEGITDMMVEDCVSGYLVEKEDLKEFVSAVERLINNANLRVTFGDQGFEIIKANFSFESYCKRLRGYYLEILGGTDLPG